MADIERQRVKFTGKRSGREDIFLPGIGVIRTGQSVEVSVDKALIWTAELPSADGSLQSDFTAVGEPVKRDPDEVSEIDMKQHERLVAAATPEEPTPDPVAEPQPDKPASKVTVTRTEGGN